MTSTAIAGDGSPTGGIETGPPPSPAVARPAYRPDIQGLRAIAVLLVVVYHSGLALTGGFIGVDVFFVISGFVIARGLRHELLTTGRVDLVRFYTRRVRRLLPALALVAVLTLVGSALVLSPNGEIQLAARTAIAASLFWANQSLYQNDSDYFAPAADANPFLHTWSLSLEEQFYFVLPALLFGLWWLSSAIGARRPLRGVLVGVGVLSLLSLVGAVLLTSSSLTIGSGDPVTLAFYSMPFRLWEFAVGVALGLVAVDALSTGGPTRRSVPAVAGPLAVGAGLVALAVCAVTYGARTTFPGLTAIVPVVATGLLIVAVPGVEAVRRVLAGRTLGLIGDVSYGWYLLHWPLIVFARRLFPDDEVVAVLVAVVTSLGLAVVLFRLVEEPIRRHERLVGWRVVALAAVSIAVPVVVAGAIGASAASIAPSPPVGRNDDAVPLARVTGCMIEDIGVTGAVFDPASCVIGDATSDDLVLLVGDSHATSFSDVVAVATAEVGVPMATWNRATCPFVGRAAPGYDECLAWQDDVLDVVDELRPAVVVIANRSPAYVLPDIGGASPLGPIATSEGDGAADRAAALASWQEGLTETVQALIDREIEVVIVSTVPEYPSGSFGAPSVLRPDPGMPEVTLAEVDERRGEVVEIERRVAAALDGVTVFDPADALCGATCTPIDDEGRWMYFDNHHLNRFAAPVVAPSFAEALRSILDR